MRMALIRSGTTGRPKIDNPETVKLFWDEKDKDGNPMLSEDDKAFLRTQHNLDEKGRTPKPEVLVKIESKAAAQAVWKYLSKEQRKVLKQQHKELKDLEN